MSKPSELDLNEAVADCLTCRMDVLVRIPDEMTNSFTVVLRCQVSITLDGPQKKSWDISWLGYGMPNRRLQFSDVTLDSPRNNKLSVRCRPRDIWARLRSKMFRRKHHLQGISGDTAILIRHTVLLNGSDPCCNCTAVVQVID